MFLTGIVTTKPIPLYFCLFIAEFIRVTALGIFNNIRVADIASRGSGETVTAIHEENN